MDNLRTVLSIVLNRIPSNEILRGNIVYNNITKDIFVKLAGYYVKNYSNDELENLFRYIQNEYQEQSEYVRGFPRERNFYKQTFDVFDAILIFTFRVLQELDGEPVCQYEHLLKWRITSHELDEDVFTTAFLAYRDIRYCNEYRDFSWRPVIRHNNVYLNKILSQGMADNHFHLKGSAPQFPLSWISMMNDITNKRFRELLDTYSKERLSTNYFSGTNEEHLYISYLKAALIRCFLFAKLTGNSFVITEERIQEENDEKIENFIIKLLCQKNEILFYRNEIQNNITYFKYDSKKNAIGYGKSLDYMLNGNYNYRQSINDINHILSGERWFLYTMFRCIYTKDKRYAKYFNLFYAYLVIKETIRSELVQTNSNIGFDNFAKYQDRKEDFIENTEFEEKYIEMAVKGTIYNQNIVSLEARITPKNSVEANRKYIEKLDSWICKEDTSLKERYFYVFHFIKEKDNYEAECIDTICRHYEKRKNLKMQALSIAGLRDKYPNTAIRVKGIDACAKEIGCRPEVFSQAYRYLRNHIVYETKMLDRENGDKNRLVKIGQLSLTYHIGEDYLDVVDGLRAIDEAVRFLRLDCGSRLGHALALGVDVEEYYQGKNYVILISQQDYLDNLVWVYNRIKKFSLHGYEDLLLFIEQEYSKYFRLIYGNYISDSFFYNVLKEAKEYFQERNKELAKAYENSHFNFRISEYYMAWQLRGDNPECYINGYFKEIDNISEWNQFAVNRERPDDYKMRFNPECAYLYFLYHYSGHSKKEGAKQIEVKVSQQMVKCVQEIQYKMQKWISGLGIGIETNPSSNYLIGSFKRYDKHPIFKFYNLGLTTSESLVNSCAQIPVCVNTDDQGVFATYLENEYALLVLALEKLCDENGNKKYNRTMIYQWIDEVRKMGLNLSFKREFQGNTII